MALTLNRLLRQLRISTKRSFSTQSSAVKLRSDVINDPAAKVIAGGYKNDVSFLSSIVTFTPQSLTLNSNFTSDGLNISTKIIICPVTRYLEIIEPPTSISVDNIEESPRTSVQFPTNNESVVEKQAAILIKIRKNKMKRHKLRKLRKRMKFEWGKRRQRRELRKEKLFQAELLAQVREAEKFDAVNYVAEKIQKATEIPIPRFWKGRRLPEFLIREKLGLPPK